MSSETVPRRTKGPPTESDLSQVMAHGPALCAAYGRFLGAALMMFAIAKTRRGSFGLTAIVGLAGTIIYNAYLK